MRRPSRAGQAAAETIYNEVAPEEAKAPALADETPAEAAENAPAEAGGAASAATVSAIRADMRRRPPRRACRAMPPPVDAHLAGQSGVLPVIVGVILISIIFQSQNPQFLSPGNLVNLLVQGSVFMLIGMGEDFVLLLGETDLSLGFVAGIGGTITTILVQPEIGWPWWLAIPAALIATSILGVVQGTLVSRLRLPSFVVTLAGLLGFEGVMIQLLGTGGTIPIPDDTINNLANGTISPMGSWMLAAVVVAIYAAYSIFTDQRRRRSGLVAPPPRVTALKILAAAAAGIAIVLITNFDRGVPGLPAQRHAVGDPHRVRRARRLVAAAGADPLRPLCLRDRRQCRGGRRAGISLARIRTLAFTIAGLTAGIGGIIYASRLRSMSTSFDGGTIVLYVVASAVIGGTACSAAAAIRCTRCSAAWSSPPSSTAWPLLGLPAAVQLMATAVVLLASITVDVVVRRWGETTR